MGNDGTLIVDDHPLFREGLKAALESAGGFSPFYEADSVGKATAMLEGFRQRAQIVGAGPQISRPALAILDLTLPDGSGFEVLEQFAGESGGPRFLMLSMHAERAHAIKALRAGADGYASKQIPLEALILGLRLILAGQCFIEAELLRDILTEQTQRGKQWENAKAKLSLLSEREREAFLILASGGTTKDVAGALGISRRSAENYQTAVYHRLEVNSPTALALFGIRSGAISL